MPTEDSTQDKEMETTPEGDDAAEVVDSGYENMLYPNMEDLVDKAGSKFLLVTLSAQRANDINTYYQGLGSGMVGVAPPQTGGDYSSYLSIAFEEIAKGKTVLSHTAPPPRMQDLPTAAPEDEEVQEAKIEEIQEVEESAEQG